MWIQTKLFNKIFENLNFDSFAGPKFGPLVPLFYTPTKIAPMRLLIKFQGNIAETFQENKRKPIFWPIFTLFGARKFGPRGSFFTHRNILRKWQKWKFFFHIFWGYIVVHNHARYRNDRWKLWGSLLDLKKADGCWTARHRISSADYVRSGAKKGLNLLKYIHLYEHSFSW